MQISPLQVHARPNGDCVYTACDQAYFREFGPSFANSILTNSPFGVHFHIFNPEPQDLEFCRNQVRITCSSEQIPIDQFRSAVRAWETITLDDVSRKHLERTQNAMGKGADANLLERMQKTYFACVRFIRLRDLFDPRYQTFAMDVDAVVRAPLQSPGAAHGFYIHRIHGRKARYLAGGIWINAQDQNRLFLDKYAAAIEDFFNRDYIYWGIDQDVLEDIVPEFDHAQLPQEYIDWDMQPTSLVWTAKGTRKSSQQFLEEKRRFWA